MSIALSKPEVLGATQVGAHLREASPSPAPSAKLGRRRPNRTLSARRAAGPGRHRRPPPHEPPGGVFRLRPIITAPSMRIIEMPGRSPTAQGAERIGRGRARPARRRARCPRPARPRSRPRRARGRAPCCPVAMATATSGATSAERGEVGHHAQDPERHDAGARRRVVADDHATRGRRPRARAADARGAPPGRCRSGRSRSPCRSSTSARCRASGHGRRAAVDVADDVRPRLQHASARDRVRAGDRRPAGVERRRPSRAARAQATIGAAWAPVFTRAQADLADER